MNRRRLALLCGQPEEYCQDLFIKGFTKTAFESDFDVCVFAMYQKYQDSFQREIGDTSIFNMVNYTKFDGVVVMADTLQTPGLMEKIEDSLTEGYEGKVLFIESETDKFPVELQDNYNPIKKLISHLIEVHNYTDIAFLTGKSWHPHAQKRLKAFLDTMEEHGLEVKDNRVFYGDFWYTSGESVVDKLTRHNAKLPQAIACANDAMALGLAKALCNKGYKIPDDVAVIGYDSNDEGKHAPVPLTSMDLPIYAFGEHTANDMIAMLNGGEPSEFIAADPDIFEGCTCGCSGSSVIPVYNIRNEWDTELSGTGVSSVFNHMGEDVANQMNFKSLVNTIFSYVYQIRPFDLYSLCVNYDWKNKVDGFSDQMIETIRCGSDGMKDVVNFDVPFDRDLMIPDMYEEYDKPRVYYFLPFTFDDSIFGYTVHGFSDPSVGIVPDLRIWNRRCMLGFELMRRYEEDARSEKIIRDSITKDSMTNLFNYQGLLSEGSFLIGKMRYFSRFISVLALDVKDLTQINENFGRNAGDKAIVNIAGILESVFTSNESICACLGNGEFVALQITSSGGEDEMLISYDKIKDKLEEYNENPVNQTKLYLYYGIETGAPESMADFERLINTAISKKNSNKIKIGKAQQAGLSEEEKKKSLIVNEILESNRLNYHFQPIVRVVDGEIFAYEALMRVDVNPYIDPPTVIRYASLSDRLSDVEYETFDNVIDIVEHRPDIFDGTRKVFINSIPGEHFPEDKRDAIADRIRKLNGTVVIELTEQSELSDDELADIKRVYSDFGVETAVDDYGTGYSNVTNLLRYMPRYVKIDRMLLTDIQNSPQKQHFVKDIITFSHDNDIITLAEGVETTEELNTVIMLGVDLIQGFYTARPSAEIIKSIDPKIRKEICEFRMRYEESSEGEVLIAGREGRIVLPKLHEDGIKEISVSRKEATFIDFTLTGSPELVTSIIMNVSNGYRGRITLENVCLGLNTMTPAISITGDSDVTFVLKGNNRLMNSVYVEAGSTLRIEGEGDLNITISDMEFFGIGAGPDKPHGNIIIDDLNGNLVIMGNGAKGVGIGSGIGGDILISHSNVKVNIPGRSTVGIGNLCGNSNIRINDSEVGINMKCMECAGIGSQRGRADIQIENSNVDSAIDGLNVLLIGSFDMMTVPVIRNSDINSSIQTEIKQADERNSAAILNGALHFDENGKACPT